MTDTPAAPAAWHPDPFGRFEVRYWDGTQWTEHVARQGRQMTDPPVGAPHVPTVNRPADKIARDVDKASKGAPAAFQGGGHVLTEPILVINQKAKVLEVNTEYAIFSPTGQQLGAVRQVGQSGLKKAMRVLTSYDQFMTHSYQLVDANGAVVLTLVRPAKLVKSRVVVSDGSGNEVGQIRQLNAMGKIRFGIEVGGTQIGAINGENWRAWNFAVLDGGGTEIARITKTWEGMAKTMFTTADNYVVHIHRPLEDPLRMMVVAAAIGVDTALKQDSRGLG